MYTSFVCNFCETIIYITLLEYERLFKIPNIRFCSESCFIAYKLKHNKFFSINMKRHHFHYSYDDKVICYYFSLTPSDLSKSPCKNNNLGVGSARWL